MTAPIILGRPSAEVLGDIGIALLNVKNTRGLTLDDMGARLGVSRETLSQYIAGETEMGLIKWLRANEAFPELAGLIEETAADRAAKARQRALDLALPLQRERAA